MLYGIEFYIVNRTLHRNINREVNSIARKHQRRLKALTKNCVLPTNSSETVTNISSQILTQDERESLKFGSSHSVFSPNINKTDIYASFESIYQTMKSCLVDKSNDHKLKSDLSNIAKLYFNSIKPSNKDTQNHRVLESLYKIKILSFLNKIKGMEWLY